MKPYNAFWDLVRPYLTLWSPRALNKTLEVPGNSIQDPEVRVKKLAIEISNGRLAMFAIIGMFFQESREALTWAA